MRGRVYGSASASAILVLIAVNLVIFLVTFFQDDMIAFFGLRPASLTQRPWTIVTSMFIHGGIWHIAANMFTLYFFGRALTVIIGEGWFLATYFLGGLVGNALYALLALYTPLAWPYSVVIGASGAVFAVGGTLTVLQPRLRVMIFPIPAPIPLWTAMLGVFVILSFIPGVAWQAHLGGLALGLAVGYLFRKRRRFILL